MRALHYFVVEAAASVWRARRTNLVSVMTIASAIFVLAAVLALTTNLRQVASRWSEAAEMSVFLRDSASDGDRQAIERSLGGERLVTSREFVSKADALARFRQDFPDLAGGAAGLPANPFPASYELRLGSAVPGEIERLARRMSALAGVSDVRFDRAWLDRLMTLVDLIGWAGAVVGFVLVVASALTITNVVRLALHARRDEIEIMQLVGAPLGFIRGPFVVEGIIQGGLGAVVGLSGLAVALVLVRARAGALVDATIGPGLLTGLPAALVLIVGLGGMLVGCLGGFLAARAVR